jgi:hypothetical protein
VFRFYLARTNRLPTTTLSITSPTTSITITSITIHIEETEAAEGLEQEVEATAADTPQSKMIGAMTDAHVREIIAIQM